MLLNFFWDTWDSYLMRRFGLLSGHFFGSLDASGLLLAYFWHTWYFLPRPTCFNIWHQTLSASWSRESLSCYISLSATRRTHLSTQSNSPNTKPIIQKKEKKKNRDILSFLFISTEQVSVYFILIWLADLSAGHLLRYLYHPTTYNKISILFQLASAGGTCTDLAGIAVRGLIR